MKTLIGFLTISRVHPPFRTILGRCIMTSSAHGKDQQDHLDITANNSRIELVCPAVVNEVKHISPSVKQLKLHVKRKDFTFKAGQWVDFFIPDVKTVGGFSISSAPKTLKEEGVIKLGVKASDHPPAQWVHSKCKEGDAVSVRAGGDFYYDPQTAEEHTDLLLVAGGVGKNPIYSILQHFVNLQLEYCDRERKVVLLYSSSAREELLYRDHIKELADKSSNIFYKFFVTQQPENKESTHMRNGRIGEDDVTEALEKLNTEKLLCYICGPSTMSNAVEGFLLNSGVPKNKIMYEKWW